MQTLEIAGFTVQLEGFRMEDTFTPFEKPADGSRPDLTAQVITDHNYTSMQMPDARYKTITESSVLLQNDCRIAFTSSNDLFSCVEYSTDYTRARHYFNDRRYRDLPAVRAEKKLTVDSHFFLELRRQMIGYLFRRGDIMLHSVSVLYEGEAFVLSAPSETGKSTHGQLWADHFGAKIMNGDNNACRTHEDGTYVYGLPWCGTSGIACNEKAPLRAVVFLEQAPVNEVRRLSLAESLIRLAARCYLPVWDIPLMKQDYLKPMESIIKAVPCYLLKCTPNPEAAEVLRSCLYETNMI